MDRQEKGLTALSAVQEVEQNYQIPVVSIAKLTDLFKYIEHSNDLAQYLPKVDHYRQQYCIYTN
jgi:orotate phosphoribosyltransferase